MSDHQPTASPAAPPPGRGASGTAPFAWLLALAIPVFFVALGANTIWDANEAFYVETPRQMVVSGDYVTPRFNDADRVNKPVLSYWVVAGLYRLFGTSVAVERFGIALGAMGILLAAFVVGRAVRSTRTGVLAALIVATSPRVVMHARRIFIDVYITLFMSLTLACFVLAERSPGHRRRWLWAMYVCIGLGTLTKGPIALFFPAVVGTIWLTVERRWRDVRRLELLPGALIVLAIVVPWYAALYARHGWGPVTGFFLGENVDRYLTSMVPGDARAPWFYLPVLLSDLFPWALVVLVPLATGWRRVAGEGAALRRLLWWWTIAIVGVFSLSQTKQDLYVFPVTVAVAALVADALVAADFGRRRRAVAALLAAGAALSVAAAPVIYRFFGTGTYALAGSRLAAVVLLVGGVASLGVLARARGALAVWILAATFVVFDYVFVTTILPSFERFKATPAFAEAILARGGPDDRVGAYHFMQPSFVYYTRRPVHELASIEQVRDFYRGGPGWVMMTPDRYREVEAAVAGVCVGDRHEVFGGRLDELLEGRPSEVYLVTNRCGAAPLTP